MKSMIVASAMVLMGTGAHAAPLVLGFEGLADGFFTDPFTESGVRFTVTGEYFADSSDGVGGSVGLEDSAFSAGDVLTATLVDGGTFSFVSIAAKSSDAPSPMTLTGLQGGATVASDSYTIPDTGIFGTFTADNLAGQTIDTLQIFLSRDVDGFSVIDDLTLEGVAAIPLPASGAALLFGLGLLGLRARRG